MPNPREGNPPQFVKGSGDERRSRSRPGPIRTQHVIADVFKIVNDPFVGKLGVFRVYQGTVKKDTQLFVDDGKKPFKVGHLFKLKGKDHVEIEQAIPGDIAAVAKVDEIHFDAVLHDSHDEDQIHLKPLDFPKPMFGLAIEASAQGPGTEARHRAAQARPRKIRASASSTTRTLNETVIRGLSDLHLQLMLERMKERYGVEVTTRPPTHRLPRDRRRQGRRPSSPQEADRRRGPVRRGVPAHRTAAARRRFRVRRRGQGRHDSRASSCPAVEKGVRQVLDHGAIAGYQMQDVRVIVYDGKYHPVDCKEVAFVTAGKKAFLDAIAKARPQVLEPIVNLDVFVPEQHMGDITGGLASKRARINGTDSLRGGEIVIKAQVPLAEAGPTIRPSSRR